MKRLLILLPLITLWGVPCVQSATLSDEFSRIRSNIWQQEIGRFENTSLLDDNIRRSLELMTSEGRFSDLDYTSVERVAWKPLSHMSRILEMAAAYTMRESGYYQDSAIFDVVVGALEWWEREKPRSDNWWYRQIAVPQQLGKILVVMRFGVSRIPAELEDALLTYMTTTGGDPRNWTGANKADIALHWLYRGCLRDSLEVAGLAAQEAYFPLRYTSQEGVQYDNSYFQHGHQLYIGGYGKVFIVTISDFAAVANGTSLGVSGDKLDILRDFVLETYQGVIRGGYMFFNAAGRSLSRDGALGQADLVPVLENMRSLDPERRTEYGDMIKRVSGKKTPGYRIKPSNTLYYIGDYMTHVRPGFSVGIRAVSNRTARLESGNGENLKGFFLSDGSVNVAVTGNEYRNIFPVWNWVYIPGVTAPALDTLPQLQENWGANIGTSDFVGGVSDGEYGLFAYDMDERGYGVSARKSWFCFDEQVVCLGAGVNSKRPESVNTTVTQCLLNGGVPRIFADGEAYDVNTGDAVITNVDWVCHNGIGYFFPEGGDVGVRVKRQSGRWSDINTSESRDLIEKDVFTLWIDHGQAPTGRSYAYIIVPDAGDRVDAALPRANEVEIVENTAALQAVANRKAGILQAVFYDSGTLAHEDIKVSVSGRCALMIKRLKGGVLDVYIADPSRKSRTLDVEIAIGDRKQESVMVEFGSDLPERGKPQKFSVPAAGR